MIIDPKLRDMEDSLRRDYNAARDPNADHTLLIHTAAVLFAVGASTAATVLLGLLVVAAGLEAFAGLCLGCHLFRLLMRAGVVPAEVCERCADIWAPRPEAASH